MSEHIQKTIQEVQQQVDEMSADLRRKKKMVNDLADLAGLPAVYEIEGDESKGVGTIRRDQWYGQPLATAIREYLEMRRVGNQGPATVNEVFDALRTGGYSFDTKDDANAKRGLRISLTKNTAIFHRLPDGKHYGLLDWYPDVKEKKVKSKTDEPAGPDTPADSEDPTSNSTEGAAA